MMEALMERLTTTEAAVVAGVSVPQINRIIDEKILPEDLYSTSPTRSFRADAALLIAFYFETAESLTTNARLENIRNASLRQSIPALMVWRPSANIYVSVKLN